MEIVLFLLYCSPLFRNKSKRHTTSQHKELKKEESEKEEEDCGIKKEETTRNVAQGQDGVIGTDPEPVRK